MTFQVAMVGTDGILLASDRRQIYTISSTEQNPYAPNQPGEVSKFLQSTDGNLICGFAGSPTSRDVARDVATSTALADLSNLDIEIELERISNKKPQPIGLRDEILIASHSDLSRFRLLSRWPHVTRQTECTEWITTGDNSGPARFFLHHFYEKRPIIELERLALLTLNYASLENPSGIHGYEVWTVTKSGIKQQSIERSLVQTEESRKEIEALVWRALFG